MIPSRAIRLLPLLTLVLALLGHPGCNTAPEDVRLPVEGKVTLAGKPLTTGTVILKPDAAKGNTSKHEPRGKIDAQGNYQIETALKKGAPPGWYKVAIMAFEPGDPKNYVVGVSLLHEDYNDPDKTGIAIDVVNTPAPGAYDLKLEAK
jgi:hypothetical protein